MGTHGAREEELDAIRAELNRQLVERFFEPDLIDRDEIRNAVFLEETLSFTLTPQKGDEPDDKDGED